MNHDREAARRLATLRILARVMDDAFVIPGTKIRIGLDALLGLLPGIGDAATAVVAAYALLAAARVGAPPAIIARMGANVLVDALIGSIPVLGDLFDIGWKANRRNAILLERWLAQPAATAHGSRIYVAGVALALVLLLAAVVAGILWLGGFVLRQFDA